MALNKKKNNKKLIILIIIAVVLIAAVITGIVVYKNITGKLYNGEGKYYSQQEDGKYIQFNKDNTFTLVTRVDENTEEVLKGTWTENDNKIVLTFTESGKFYTFIKTDDDYLYREDTVFKGKPGDEKLLNNAFVLENVDGFREEMWFENNGKMDKVKNGKIVAHGTYTRVDNILIVRYDNASDKAERFLVLENGITKDIYNKDPAKK